MTDPLQSGDQPPDSNSIYLAFVRTLAPAVDVWSKLMADHIPDEHDLCRACTTPGRGTPYLDWPCSMWSLGHAAKVEHGKT